jgi:hypothetical protein
MYIGTGPGRPESAVPPNSDAGSERHKTGSLQRELVCVIIGRYGRVVDDIPGSGDRSSMVTSATTWPPSSSVNGFVWDP